jgi:hypothetical protein
LFLDRVCLTLPCQILNSKSFCLTSVWDCWHVPPCLTGKINFRLWNLLFLVNKEEKMETFIWSIYRQIFDYTFIKFNLLSFDKRRKHEEIIIFPILLVTFNFILGLCNKESFHLSLVYLSNFTVFMDFVLISSNYFMH